MTPARTPPHDVASESAIIGSVLLDNGTLDRLVALVKPEDFYVPRHRVIWQHIIAMAERGMAIDHVTLGASLRDAGDIERIGGAQVLISLTDAVVTTANAPSYAQLVGQLSVARRVVAAAQEIAARGYAGVTDFKAFIADARQSIADACGNAGAEDGGAQLLAEELKRVWTDVVEQRQPEGLVPTGMSTIDRICGGLWPGVLTVLAGRPGMGKSAFVLNVATNAALAGKRVLYMTLEDTRYFIAVRTLSRFAQIDNIALTMRAVRADQHRQLMEGFNAACGLTTLWVDDASGLSIADIRARVLAHRDQHGIDLLVIDHLLEIQEDAESETASVSRAARGCRDLVKELHVPGLLAHQLNRKVEDRADKRPALADLKQTGKVEEVARTVMFLYRPGYYEPDGDSRRDIQCLIAKANHGKTGMAKLWGNLAEMYIRGWEAGDGDFPGSSPGRPSEAPRPASAGKWRHTDGSPVDNRRRYGAPEEY